MSLSHAYVIIGNGIAGVTAAEILRREDPASSITMVADDPFPAYYRPALKDFLGGHLPEERLWARPASFYQELRLRFMPARAVALAPARHCVQLHTGEVLGYEKLLLANGARARVLSCPGLDLAGVSTLRTVADYQEILSRLEHVRRVVITGSGTLALESAETLRHAGYEVTHLLRGNTLWSEVLDPVASDMVLQEERRVGIDVRTGEEIARITGRDGQVSGVVTTSGANLPCELVLIAIGIDPLIDFIRQGGVACGRGVRVDGAMRTSAPDIFAAGDVIETTDALTGRTRVLGQWFPAIQQAQIAAWSMLNASAAPVQQGTGLAPATLYNATFLYGLDFVSIGLTTSPALPGFQEIVAEPRARNYRKVILYRGNAAGALLLGDRSLGMALKRAIDHHVPLAALRRQLFAQDFSLDAWLDQQGVPAPLLAEEQLAASQQHAGGMALESGETGMLSGDAQGAEAYLVPVPHPGIQVAVREVRLEQLAAGERITFGRQEGVSWPLDHRSVSRVHAEITQADRAYWLRDAGSANGTFVNGVPLDHEQRYQLHAADLVRFGDVQFRFELRAQPELGAGQTQAFSSARGPAYLQGTALQATITRAIPAAILAALPAEPALAILTPDGTHRIFPLNVGRRYTIGRDMQNDLILLDTSTSRRHAELLSTPAGFAIRDLQSSYGVLVNQMKITNLFHLSHGDRIVLGNVLLFFSSPLAQSGDKAPGLQSRGLRAERPSLGSVPALAATGQLAAQKSEQLAALVATGAVAGMEHRKETTPLSQARLQFEIDMCIGCNRCMAACPVPLSEQVSIASLNQATVSEQILPLVARFTHECVMCGSCVPVCPVDNHRDLLMLDLKRRLGVSWESQPDMERVAAVLPAGWAPRQLVQRLREQPFLQAQQQVPDTYVLHLIAASRSVLLEPGEELLREGEYGRDLYVILEGQLELTTADRAGHKLPVALLQRGEYVGEDAMLTGLPYQASAHARKPALLLQVPEQVVQRLSELVPGVRQHFSGPAQARSLQTLLARLHLFQGAARSDLQWLINQSQVGQYERDELLFVEDRARQPAREAVHILLEGFVKVTRHTAPNGGQGERIIAYRQGGDYFVGGLDLLGDGRAVTVTTINRCRVALIPQQAMLAFFQRYPEIEQRFSTRLQEYIQTSQASSDQRSGSLAREGLHALVNDGVVEGTEVLVIDLDKCIHCNECEFACERRHGHSRMNRKGMVVGNISITTTCRHCQDPVCMLCSRAGIARHPNGEVYITESCIGCGICAERCPYGAIAIAEIDETVPEKGSWQRFSAWFTKNVNTENGHKALPVINAAAAGGRSVALAPFDATVASGYDELRKKIAIKCDLCAGYGDQACVQACPAGAAFRVQPTRFFGSTEEILQRQQ